MADRQRVLVTGASGFVGGRLCAHLARQGFEVCGSGRRTRPDDLGVAIPYVQSDICDAEGLYRLAGSVDMVVHAAAMLHRNAVGPDLAAQYRRVNVSGTEAVLEYAQRVGAQRFVLLSTISVYGDSGGGPPLTEEAPASPTTCYARTKLEAEQLALAAGRATVLRLAAIYGAGMKGNYLALVKAIRHRLYLRVGRVRSRRTLLHVEDACSAVAHVLRGPLSPALFNVTDLDVHSLDAIVRAISAALGVRPLPITLPRGLVVGCAQLADRLLHGIRPSSPSLEALVAKYTEDVAVSGAKFQDTYGYRPTYDLVTGWREAVGCSAAAGLTAQERRTHD